MRRWPLLGLVALTSLGSLASDALGARGKPAAPPPAQQPRDAPVSRAVAPRPKQALCLPVVSADCGCSYSCGVGWPLAKGGKWPYRVRHNFWRKTELKARVARWCVGKQCTRAFFVQLVCSGICPRRPADATCHFAKDLCVSGRKASKQAKNPARR